MWSRSVSGYLFPFDLWSFTRRVSGEITTQAKRYLFPFDLWSFTRRVSGEITTQAKPSFAALDI